MQNLKKCCLYFRSVFCWETESELMFFEATCCRLVLLGSRFEIEFFLFPCYFCQSEGVIRSDRLGGGGGGGGNALSIFSLFPLHTWFVFEDSFWRCCRCFFWSLWKEVKKRKNDQPSKERERKPLLLRRVTFFFCSRGKIAILAKRAAVCDNTFPRKKERKEELLGKGKKRKFVSERLITSRFSPLPLF